MKRRATVLIILAVAAVWLWRGLSDSSKPSPLRTSLLTASPAASLPGPAAPPGTAHATNPAGMRVPHAAAVQDRVLDLLLAWEAEPDPYRQNTIQAQLDAFVTDDNAAEIFRGLPPDFANTPFGIKVLERWVTHDRPAAIAEIARRENPPPAHVSAVLLGWIVEDPPGVQRYVATLPPGSWRERVLETLGSDATGRQIPTDAIDLLRQMQPGERQTTLLRSAAFKWAESHPEEAAEWVGRVADPVLRAKLVGGVARGYAMTDPESAAEWLLVVLPPGEDLNQGLALVVNTWVQEHNVSDLEAWINGLPQGSTRDHARLHLSQATERR